VSVTADWRDLQESLPFGRLLDQRLTKFWFVESFASIPRSAFAFPIHRRAGQADLAFGDQPSQRLWAEASSRPVER
jgi:hypothetical protein